MDKFFAFAFPKINVPSMSKADILAELPNLSPADRGEILAQLWLLEEHSGPTPAEKALLNEAQARYHADPSPGAAWSEVETRLRQRS